ncbi:hypothetical protein AAMO2058_001358200 [Amorphochlora amoebiformis]
MQMGCRVVFSVILAGIICLSVTPSKSMRGKARVPKGGQRAGKGGQRAGKGTVGNRASRRKGIAAVKLKSTEGKSKKKMRKKDFLRMQKENALKRNNLLQRAKVNLVGLSAKQKRFVKRAVKRVQKRTRQKKALGRVIDSRYPGVTIDKTETKWRASVYNNESVIALGNYDTEEDAWAVAKNYRKQLNWPPVYPIPLDVWHEIGGTQGSILASAVT